MGGYQIALLEMENAQLHNAPRAPEHRAVRCSTSAPWCHGGHWELMRVRKRMLPALACSRHVDNPTERLQVRDERRVVSVAIATAVGGWPLPGSEARLLIAGGSGGTRRAISKVAFVRMTLPCYFKWTSLVYKNRKNGDVHERNKELGAGGQKRFHLARKEKRRWIGSSFLKVRTVFPFLLFLPHSFQCELRRIIIYLFCLCDNCIDNLVWFK